VTTGAAIEAVLGDVGTAAAVRVPAVGLGHVLGLTGRPVQSAALMVDDRLAHLVAFPTGGLRPSPPAGAVMLACGRQR
jgi:hypothetical protein